MRVILTQNVIVDGGARSAGYAVDSDEDYCEQLVRRGLAVHGDLEIETADTLPPIVAEPQPVATDSGPIAEHVRPAESAAAHETKSQRKAREKAERDASEHLPKPSTEE